MQSYYHYHYIHLIAVFPGQPGLALGLRASGNLPVSYVLTGNLPVTYR